MLLLSRPHGKYRRYSIIKALAFGIGFIGITKGHYQASIVNSQYCKECGYVCKNLNVIDFHQISDKTSCDLEYIV